MGLSSLFDSKKIEKTQSSQQGQSWNDLSDEATNYWKSIQGRFSDPWTPVGLDPAQTAATQAQAGYASGLNPAFNAATSIGQTGITTADIQRFQNPYQQQVINSAIGTIRDNAAMTGSQQEASAAKMGALGGTSGINRRMIRDESTDKLIADTTSNLNREGYQSALNAANQSMMGQVAGAQAASGIAGQMGNLTNQYYGMGAQNTDHYMKNAMMPYQIGQWGASTLGGLAGAAVQHNRGSGTGQSETTAKPGWGNTIMNAAGMALKAWMASDERVKEDIVPIGESFDGQPIYEFNYKGDPRRTIGLLAQDVEEHSPEAVAEVDGVKMVDYDRALKDSKPGRAMSGGGAVGEGSQGEKDPHAKFRSAFEAITGMLSKARGGAVSGLMPPGRAAGGPIGSWETTITPASSGNPAMSGLADDMMKFGKQDDKQQGGGSALGAQQQALAQMLSSMSRPGRPFGGAVWGETGPEFGESSGLAPPVASREGSVELLAHRPDDPVTRRELPLPVVRDLDMTQPRSVRTFNPGAMNAGRFAQSRGAIGSDGRVAVFPDEATGYKAMSDLLDVYARRGQNTVATIIGGLPEKPNLAWAPRGVDNNSTDAYIKKVATTLGIDPNAPLLPEHREPLMRAMAAYESGSAGGARPPSSGAAAPGPVRVASAPQASAAGAQAMSDSNPETFLERLYPKSRVAGGLNALADGMLAWKDPLFGSRTEGMAQHFAKKTADEASARMDALRADRQASQFAERLARERDIALGVVGGRETVDARRVNAAIAQDTAAQKIRADESALKQEAVFLDRAGAVAQSIANEADPISAQAKWDALVKADPRYADLLKKGGIDPADHKAGAAYIQSIARGFKEQPKLGVTDLKQGEVKIFYDPKTGKEVGRLEGPGGALKFEDKVKMEESLRKEVNTYAKDYTTIRDATSTLERVSKAGTAFSDMATIFQYMKILDPGSVVREGEFANAQNAAGVPDQVVNMYNKALQGNFLNQKQRDDIVARARDVATTKRTYYDGRLRQYSDLAKRSGLDPNNVILIEPKTEAEANSVAPAPGRAAPAAPNPAQGLSDDEIKKRLGIP